MRCALMHLSTNIPQRSFHQPRRGQRCARCYLLFRLLFGGKGRMSLLPQELSRPQEGLRVLELPSLEEEAEKNTS